MEGVSTASSFPSAALTNVPFARHRSISMRPADVTSGSRGHARRTGSAGRVSHSGSGSTVVLIKSEPLSACTSPVSNAAPPVSRDVSVKKESTTSPSGSDSARSTNANCGSQATFSAPSTSALSCSGVGIESSASVTTKKSLKSRSFSASGGVPSASAGEVSSAIIGRHSALSHAFPPPPSASACTKSGISTRDFQRVVLKNLTDGSIAKVNGILEQITALSDVEKAYLYSRVPDGHNGEDDPLKACANPLGSRFEITQTLSWIQSHLVEDPEVSLPKQEVYDDYTDYCGRNGLKPLSTADFGKAMKQIFPLVKPRRLGVRGQSRYCYSGLRKKCVMPVPVLADLSRSGISASKSEADYEKEREDVGNVLTWASKILNMNFRSVSDLATHLKRSGVVGAHRGTEKVSPTKSHVQSQSSVAAGRKVVGLARSHSTCTTPVSAASTLVPAPARHGRSFSGGCSIKRSGATNAAPVVVKNLSSSTTPGCGSVKEGDLIIGQYNRHLLAASATADSGSSTGSSLLPSVSSGAASSNSNSISRIIHAAPLSTNRAVIKTKPPDLNVIIQSQQNQAVSLSQKPMNKLPIPRLRPVAAVDSAVNRSNSSSPSRTYSVRYLPIQPKPPAATSSVAATMTSASAASLAGSAKRPAESPGEQPAVKEQKTSGSDPPDNDDDDLLRPSFDDRIDLSNVAVLNGFGGYHRTSGIAVTVAGGADGCFSAHDSQDELSSIFSKDQISEDVNFGSIAANLNTVSGDVEADEDEKKRLVDDDEDENKRENISQLRQLLAASEPAVVTGGTSIVLKPSLSAAMSSVATSSASIIKRRVSFMNQGSDAATVAQLPQHVLASSQNYCFSSPSSASSSVPPSPGARARAFNFTPISPHHSQPSSAAQSPFISPRSTPTANLIRSRHNSGQAVTVVNSTSATPQNRSRHSSVKTDLDDSSVFVSPSGGAVRSRQNSGNTANATAAPDVHCNGNPQKKAAMHILFTKNVNAGTCATVSAAGNEFLRRRHASALASTSSVSSGSLLRYHHRPPVDFRRQCPPAFSSSVGPSAGLLPSLLLETEEEVSVTAAGNSAFDVVVDGVGGNWIDDDGRARSVPIPAVTAGQCVLTSSETPSTSNVYSSGPGTPMGAEIASINSGQLDFDLNLQLFDPMPGSGVSGSDIATSSGAPSVDSGFESCSSGRGRNLSQKSDIVGLSGGGSSQNSFVVTSRSYPNTPLPDGGLFWAQNAVQHQQPSQQEYQVSLQLHQLLNSTSSAANPVVASHSYPSTPVSTTPSSFNMAASRLDALDAKFIFDAQQLGAGPSMASASAPSSPPSSSLSDRQNISSELGTIADDVMDLFMEDLKEDYDPCGLSL